MPKLPSLFFVLHPTIFLCLTLLFQQFNSSPSGTGSPDALKRPVTSAFRGSVVYCHFGLWAIFVWRSANLEGHRRGEVNPIWALLFVCFLFFCTIRQKLHSASVGLGHPSVHTWKFSRKEHWMEWNWLLLTEGVRNCRWGPTNTTLLQQLPLRHSTWIPSPKAMHSTPFCQS